MSDKLAHAVQGAKTDCPRCHGTGIYYYDENHGTVCYRCCKHDLGFWLLSEGYAGYTEMGSWCCSAGCGFLLPFDPEEAA